MSIVCKKFNETKEGGVFVKKRNNQAQNANVDLSSLKDIKDVVIDPKLSKEERIAQFVEQIGNPYCFRCNGCIVHVSFSDTDRTLEDCLMDYFNLIS